MWNLKSDTNELTYKTEIDTYFEKKKSNGYQRGRASLWLR